MPKSIAILLLNWNTPEHTINCILSVNKFCKVDDFDIIVADNGSTDDSLSILKNKFPTLTILDNKANLGFAEGNNKLLEYSIKNDYLYSLVLNNDTEVDEDFLSPLINHLENNPKTVAVQPAIYYLYKKDELWNGGSFFNQYLGFTYSKNQKKRQSLKNVEQVEWLTGCCFLARNSALKQCGLFNSKFFLYYEDVDLSFRLRENGGVLDYLPTTKIYHEAGVSGKQKTKTNEGTLSPIIHYYTSRNKIWFLRRYANPFLLPFISIQITFYNAALLTYFNIRGKEQKAKFLIKGFKDGFFTPLNEIWL